MKLKTKIILGFFILTIASAVIGSISLYQFSILSKSFEELPNKLDKLSEEAITIKHSSKILYYDEVLTQSVRNYAFTQDTSWRERYFEVEPMLRETLELGLKLNPTDKPYFEKIGKSNEKLVEMETQAIELIDNNKNIQAISILESQEYFEHKKKYSEFLTDYSNSHNVNFGITSTNIEKSISESIIQLKKFLEEGIIVFEISLIMLILISLGLGYGIASNIVSPFTKLQKKVQNIAKGDFNTELIPEGTDEVKEIIEEFNKMAQELKKLNYTKRNITAIVSHELRTPLVPIMGNLELLLIEEKPNLTEKQKTRIMKIKKSCTYMKKLISDIIDLNKIHEGQLPLQKQVISLEKIIKDSIETFSEDIKKKNIKITTDLTKIMIDGDEIRLTQVFTNLIANAIKFCPEKKGEIKIKSKFERDKVKIILKDNGKGLEKRELSKIFETYYQVGDARTREHGGTGIGLAVCKGIIEKHGGDIWAESTGIGNGTKIFIHLPIIKNEKIIQQK